MQTSINVSTRVAKMHLVVSFVKVQSTQHTNKILHIPGDTSSTGRWWVASQTPSGEPIQEKGTSKPALLPSNNIELLPHCKYSQRVVRMVSNHSNTTQTNWGFRFLAAARGFFGGRGGVENVVSFP